LQPWRGAGPLGTGAGFPQPRVGTARIWLGRIDATMTDISKTHERRRIHVTRALKKLVDDLLGVKVGNQTPVQFEQAPDLNLIKREIRLGSCD
jgi:hypothetical protein